MALVIGLGLGPAAAATDTEIEALVAREARSLTADDGAGGAAIAVRVGGRSFLFAYGNADAAARRPVTADTLFNLGSVAKTFDATLLSHAVLQGELAFDEPVAKYVTELQRGPDIRRVTLGQVASFTSGLYLPQDHPPWPTQTFTKSGYLAYLNRWRLAPGYEPGAQVQFAQSGYILLRLALERRFGLPIGDLMTQRILKPLGLASTTLPVPASNPRTHPRGELPRALVGRTVQGYGEGGSPVGRHGDLQGYYHWVGTGQMYTSARDMAVFLAANLGELPEHRTLQDAMQLAQRGVLRFSERSVVAMAWERHEGTYEIVDRYGGMNNATAVVALLPARQLGIAIMCNRGGRDVVEAAHAILAGLAEMSM